MPNGQDDLIIPDSVKKRAETADETLYGLKIPESVRGRVAEAANKPKPPVEEKKPGLIKRGLAAVGSVLTNPSYAAAADGQRLADAKPDGQRLVSTKPDAKPDEPSAPTDWRGVDEVDAGGGTTPVFQSGQNPTAARGSVLDRPAVAAPPDRMPEEGMLTPEFVRGIRGEFGKIPPEKRFDALRELASGNGVKAMAARIILRDAEAENMRADFARQERPGMVDGLERAMAAPRVPIKAVPGNPPEATVNFPETGALAQWVQQRDAAGVASRHGAARAVADDQRSIDALTQRGQAAASDPDAKAFASENPMTSAVASGAANMLRGLDNIVPTVLDFASNLVGAKTSGAKNQSETSAWLERKAQNLMPEAGQQEMGAAWHKGEFGEWLMLNLAANAPQLAPTLVAAFVPGTQGAALGLLGGIAAGNKYADTGNSAAAVASGMVEGFSERLPLKYFERSAKALSTLPPAIRGKTVQAIGKALPIVGKHLTAQAVVGAIEEVVAQIGNNVIDATILEKDNTLLDGVAEAAVIGAFASGGLSLPQGAGAIRRAAQSPEQHIAQAIDQAASQYGLHPKAAATLRDKVAIMDPAAATAYAEKVFAAAERAGLVKKPGGGSAVRQNAKDLAAKAAKDAEAQQGDASGDSVPAGAAASSDTGLADDMDAGAILGTQAEAPQATSGEAPTEGATDGPMTDEPAQSGVEAGTEPPIEGDLTTGDGQPYGTKASARARATRDGGDVVEVLGGWVVRQSQPSNTRGTNAGDINAVSGTGSGPRPGAGGNAQPGSADTSGSGGTVDVVQGELPQPGATGTAGAVVPGADAGNRPAATGPGAGNEALTARGVMAQVDAVNTEWKDLYRDAHPYFSGDGPTRKLSPSAPQEIKDRYDAFKRNKAEAERNLKALDAPPAAAPTLTAGQSVTVDGEPYTVKSAKPKVLVLTGADGKPRTITSDSATWAKVKPAEPNSVSDKPNSGTGPRILGKIGRTPNAAETVELRPNKDGTLTPHQGKYAMVDYETGEPVVIPGDSTNEQAIDAIKKSGAMGAKDKWFGVQKEQPDVVQGRAPVAQAQPDQKGTPAGGVEPAGAATAPAVPAAGSAEVEAAGSAPVSPTTGVTNGPQAAQAQQSIAQSTQARGAATAGPAAAATAGQSATVGGSGVQAAGVKAVSQINKLVAELESLGNTDSQYSGKDYAELAKSADQKTINNTIGALRTAIAYQKQVNAKTATTPAPVLATGAVVASKDTELADKFKEFAVSNGFAPHELALAAINPQAFNAANHEIVYALEAMNAVKDKTVAEMASAWDRVSKRNAEKAERGTPQVKNAKLSVGDEVTFRGPSVQEGKGVVEAINQDGSIGIRTKDGVYKFAPDAKIAFTKTEEKQPAAPAVVPGTTSPRVETDGVAQPPMFESYADAQAWVAAQTKKAGGALKFRASDEYKAAYEQIKALYDAEKKGSDQERLADMKAAGLAVGDKVQTFVRSMFLGGDTRTGTIAMRSGAPIVKLDGEMAVSSGGSLRYVKSMPWDARWKKAADAAAQPAASEAAAPPEADPQPTSGEAAPASAPEAKAQPVAKQAQPQVTRFVTKSDMVGSTVEWQEQQASGDWMRLTTFDTMQQAKDAAASRGYDAEAIPRFVSEFSASAKRFLQAVPEAAPAERTPKAQAVKEALADERQPFEHAGLKVYPTKMRRDGAVVDVWAVQLPENKGTDKMLGDTLHTTIDEAKKSAEYEAKRDNDRKEWARKEEADRADSEAKKEANRGKNITERAADFTLNQPNKLPPSAGLGTGTRREAMDKAVEQGRAIRAETVEDTAAKNRDKKAVEAVSKAGYLLGLSNENIPVVKAGLEARARLKADKYPKIEYRVYGGRLAEGPFHTITKIEYDYAVQRQAEQFAAEQDRPTPAPMDAATHKDPGEPAEPVTPAVVREAIKTGVQATDRKPSAMKAELLAKIDEAVKDAPDYMDFQAIVKTMGLKDATAVFTDAKGTMGDKAAPQGYSRPSLRFKIEGDGVFIVNNTVRQLLTFRSKVESSPGFRDRQATGGLTERATDTLDRRSKDAAIANMLDEGDFDAATDYAAAAGISLDDVKLTKVLRERLGKWQRDTKMAAAVAEFETRKSDEAAPLELSKDGIAGREVSWGSVPNGNDSFQYAIGKTEEDGREAIYRRRADERGSYGGWRWEADAPKGAQKPEPAPAPAAEPEADDIPEAGIASQTFEQWSKAQYSGNEYKAKYLEKFGGDEKRAILASVVGTIDTDRTTAELLKAAKQEYRRELFNLPRESVIALEVWDELDNMLKVEAQRHFYDLDARITRRDQDTYSAKAKAEAAKKAPYEAAFAEVDAEIRRLDKIPGPETQKQKDLSARRDRLREAIYQIGQGKEPDGRLLRKEAAKDLAGQKDIFSAPSEPEAKAPAARPTELIEQRKRLAVLEALRKCIS